MSVLIRAELLFGRQARLDCLSRAAWFAATPSFHFLTDSWLRPKAGATAAIQPGGSMRDADVIAAADEHRMAMLSQESGIFGIELAARCHQRVPRAQFSSQ